MKPLLGKRRGAEIILTQKSSATKIGGTAVILPRIYSTCWRFLAAPSSARRRAGAIAPRFRIVAEGCLSFGFQQFVPAVVRS